MTDGKIIKRTRDEFVESLILARKKGTPAKLYISTWSVLLNPNIRFRDHGSLAVKDFLIKLETSFEDIVDHLQDYVIFLVPGAKWVRSEIKQVLVSYRSEIAPKVNSPHMHANITIKHYSAIQLDYKKIRLKVAGDLELDNILARFWVIKTDKRVLNLERYMIKDDSLTDLGITNFSSIGDLDKLGIPIGRDYVRASKNIIGKTEPIEYDDKTYFEKYKKKIEVEEETEKEEEGISNLGLRTQIFDLFNEYVGMLYNKLSLSGLKNFLAKKISTM